MESFTSTKLENGLIRIELTVQPATAQYLYVLYLRGELNASNLEEEPGQSKRSKLPDSFASEDVEIEPISSLNELEGNEIALLAALADHPLGKPLPTSRILVHMVDWRYYSKSGSEDETSRASSLRVTMQKLDKKGLFFRRGLKGNTERYLTEQGVVFAKQASDELQSYEAEGRPNEDDPTEPLPDFDPHK